MTVFEALQWASNKLKPRAESAMLDAEVLLSHAMGLPKAWLFSHFDYELKPFEADRFASSVARRSKREPVAHIVGHREFYGRKFQVTPATLVPRPETELLVEAALKAAASYPSPVSGEGMGEVRGEVLCADIGTGSGAIGVTLAAESGIPVIASDVNREALTVARTNAETLGVADKVDFRLGSLLEPLVAIFRKLGDTSPVRYLVLCANLPYLTAEQVACAEPDVKDFEPHSALIAGTDGLSCYFELFRQLKANRGLFPSRVTVLIEIDPSQRDKAVALIAHDFPAARPEVLKDLAGNERVIVAEA